MDRPSWPKIRRKAGNAVDLRFPSASTVRHRDVPDGPGESSPTHRPRPPPQPPASARRFRQRALGAPVHGALNPPKNRRSRLCRRRRTLQKVRRSIRNTQRRAFPHQSAIVCSTQGRTSTDVRPHAEMGGMAHFRRAIRGMRPPGERRPPSARKVSVCTRSDCGIVVASTVDAHWRQPSRRYPTDEP